jgi:hypothetical protein
MQKYALSKSTILKIKMQFYQTLNYVSKNCIFLNHIFKSQTQMVTWYHDGITAVCFNQREDSRHSKNCTFLFLKAIHYFIHILFGQNKGAKRSLHGSSKTSTC